MKENQSFVFALTWQKDLFAIYTAYKGYKLMNVYSLVVLSSETIRNTSKCIYIITRIRHLMIALIYICRRPIWD